LLRSSQKKAVPHPIATVPTQKRYWVIEATGATIQSSGREYFIHEFLGFGFRIEITPINWQLRPILDKR
jgi:hypothetical protein